MRGFYLLTGTVMLGVILPCLFFAGIGPWYLLAGFDPIKRLEFQFWENRFSMVNGFSGIYDLPAEASPEEVARAALGERNPFKLLEARPFSPSGGSFYRIAALVETGFGKRIVLMSYMGGNKWSARIYNAP